MSWSFELKSYLKDKKDPLCLVTVVGKAGSSYSSVGRRMLVSQDKATFGAVSGGCLEGMVISRALEVLACQKPCLSQFDTQDSTTSPLLGFNLGCEGAIDILWQPVYPSKEAFLVLELLMCRDAGRVDWASYLLEGELLGFSVVQKEGGKSYIFGADKPREKLSIEQQRVLKKLEVSLEKGEQAGEEKDIYRGGRAPMATIKVFGASPAAGYLFKLCQVVGISCQIYENREHFAKNLEGEFAIEVIRCPQASVTGFLHKEDTWVLLTHHYDMDLRLLKQILPLKPRYIGVLGSKARCEKMVDSLKQEGLSLSLLGGLYGPIGLNTGGRSCEEIAFSILSQIKVHWNQQKPAHLAAL